MQFDEWYVIRVKKVERQSAWDEHGCQMGITTMDIQVLPDGHYYEYTRIIEKHPELKEGGWRKNFLTKHAIAKEHYRYASLRKNGWYVTGSPKDKLLIDTTCIDRLLEVEGLGVAQPSTQSLQDEVVVEKNPVPRPAPPITGLDLKQIKAMASVTSGAISCVYLFFLGTVASLRETMKIPEKHPDTSMVFKYGRTIDLLQRAQRHQKTYGGLDGATMLLVYHIHVDPGHNSSAENEISHYVDQHELRYQFQTHRELLITSKSGLKQIREEYDRVRGEYSPILETAVTELVSTRKDLESALKDVKIRELEMQVHLLQLGREA